MLPLDLLFRVTILIAAAVALVSIASIFWFFPWDLDAQRDESQKMRAFYSKAYSSGTESSGESIESAVEPLSAKEQFYVDFARNEAIQSHVPELIRDFVQRYGLQRKRVLEVGAGSGLLQDAVADYTGLEISPTARRFFHKPLVEASATDIPFADNSFDALWSVWVLEHIASPEKALLEMRRVVKPGGYLFLMPALSVSRYAAHGYRVRPYSDFNWKGKLIKATSQLVESLPFRAMCSPQIKMIRSLGSRLGTGPSRLRFVRLTPNYDQYWESDSDAVASISKLELYLWFTTRGDRCWNCPSEVKLILGGDPAPYLVIQVAS
ncbi:MAG: class I SAM-dependent methyltransferase [Bryobacteraceae bacterium]|jgi:SAM-dependent methyltransferase